MITAAAVVTVVSDQTVATIEAMKMEAAIIASKAGTVERIAVSPIVPVEGGDLPTVLGDTMPTQFN